jgi:hypothetical protein
MDFPSFRVSKVGGIYVRSYPEDADIFLNGKSVQNQSGFLSRGTLISDLFPKTYLLALAAPGYLDWRENVAVSPSLVANHKYAVLVPASPTNAATGTTTEFFESQDDVILEAPDGTITLDGTTIGSGKLIAVSSDLRSIIFQATRGTYEFENVPDGTMTNLSNILQKEGFGTAAPLELFIDPASDATVLAANASKIGLIDVTQSAALPMYTAPRGRMIADTIALSPDTIAWARSTDQAGSSLLLFYDIPSGITASTTVALGASVKTLDWVSNGLLGILTGDGSFYLYDANQQNLQKVADDVTSFSATADGSRIAALESHSLEIFTIGDSAGYYRFNLPDIQDAQSAFWYRDDDHLFVRYPDHTAFLDLEDSGLENFATISSGTSPHYDPQENAFYMISSTGNLVRFDFPK